MLSIEQIEEKISQLIQKNLVNEDKTDIDGSNREIKNIVYQKVGNKDGV